VLYSTNIPVSGTYAELYYPTLRVSSLISEFFNYGLTLAQVKLFTRYFKKLFSQGDVDDKKLIALSTVLLSVDTI